MKAPARCLAAGGHFFVVAPQQNRKAEKNILIRILILFAKIITEG